MIILGIETSCDETAVSIVEAKGDLDNLSFKLLGSAVQSQVKLHAEYGGVVPNLAKREHARNLLPVLVETLKNASLIADYSKFDDLINAALQIADTREVKNIWEEFLDKCENPGIEMASVTVGPGLEPALWMGIEFAKLIGGKWRIPVVPTNHMEGHIASVLLNKTEETPNNKSQISNMEIQFPAIALLISGGHTELVLLKSWTDKEKIGETKDDAVGEAFDKVARMLGLPYPGGPEISRLAAEAREQNIENEKKFPRPMIHSKDLNFSFSGLKTAVLYYLKGLRKDKTEAISEAQKLSIAREFEDAVIETLLSKTKSAIDAYKPKTLIVGGGVIANTALRQNFMRLEAIYPDLEVLIPEKPLTTDNATMIAIAGYIEHLRFNGGQTELRADGNLDIS